MKAALAVRELTVRLGGTEVLRDVSFDVAPGQVLGVVGPNGAGKTTLVDAVTGFLPATGAVTVAGRPAGHLRPHRRAALGLARTFQSLELFEDLTVGENLAVAAEAVGRARVTQGSAGRARAAVVAGVDDVIDVLPGQLSPGRRKNVALARALAAEPTVVLLDEPAAGLDGPERAALAATLRALAQAGTAVVLIDHDVQLVMDVCDDMAVLDGGRVVAQGPPLALRGDPAVTAAWLGPGEEEPSPCRPASPSASGPPVLELRRLSAGWGGVPVVHDVDLIVGPGEVVALLGANGAGKTTTLLTVSGALAPLGGSVAAVGRPVAGGADVVARRGVAHAPQDRGVLSGLTVAEQLRLAAGPGGRAAVAAALDRLPALRPLAARRAGRLSGGEQQQLSLARAVAARPRLLLVDELSLGLSPAVVRHALAVLRALADEEGVGVLVVEQFAPLALSVAERAYVLHRGRVAIAGSAPELALQPDVVAAAYLGEGVFRPPAST